MDTQDLMRLLQSDEELDRDFVEFCRRKLIGLPADIGMKLAKQLLADYNDFKVARSMKMKAFSDVVH